MENTTTVSKINTKSGIPGSTLKIIAITVMFIDHFAAIILESLLQSPKAYSLSVSYNTVYYTYFVMRLIGRLGFPIFCFLLVEGFSHTHNKLKYLRNLAIFALVSEIPFDLAFEGHWYDFGYQNVFFTLLLGLVALIVFDYFLNKENMPNLVYCVGFLGYVLAGFVAISFIAKSDMIGNVLRGYAEASGLESTIDSYVKFSLALVKLGSIAGICFLAVFVLINFKWGFKKLGTVGLCLIALFVTYFAAEYLLTDYAGGGVLTIAAMYLFKKKSNMKAGIIGCVVLTVMQLVECTAFFMLIPLKKYNGQRGISLKYFFYAFYPAHILILYFINVLLGFSSLPWIK